MAKSSDAPKPAQMSKPSAMVAMVTAPGGPRRRAGLDFGKVAVPVALDEISEEQLAAIMADPMLTVRPSEAAPAEN